MEKQTYTNADMDKLKQGYYGSIMHHGRINDGRLLIETNIADPYDNETGWECAEWYLVDDSNPSIDINIASILVARCDGYCGVEWQIHDDDLIDELDNIVTSYNITGDLIASAKASDLNFADDDTDKDDDNDGDGYQIWVSYNYYATTINAPCNCTLVDDDNDEILFATYGEAQEWINDNAKGVYMLSHGEYSRPEYRIYKAN